MKYANVVMGRFLDRPNRFIAHVEFDGVVETVHVKNTGRCRELLQPGCPAYLSVSDNPARKTKYDLIAVEKQMNDGSGLLVNMDSQIVNDAAEEWLRAGALFGPEAKIRREVFCGASRFDFAVEEQGRPSYLEVKGVTLEQNGIASFPDAPTERGVKHLRELTECARRGIGAYVLFVVQMKRIRYLRPNDRMHQEFGEALREAAQAGVRILAMDCIVTPESIVIDATIPVDLTRKEGD